MTPNERLLGARIGGLTTLNRYGGDFLASRARTGFQAKFATKDELAEHMRVLARRSVAKRQTTAGLRS